MSILKEIVAHKRKEVEQKKVLLPVDDLVKGIYFERTAVSFKNILLTETKPVIIAEFKRKSPSKGMINEHAEVKDVVGGYLEAGAQAISVLTDKEYFAGDFNDLVRARKRGNMPILRKDFVVDDYQVYESKYIGADVILLIADILTQDEIKELSALAHSLKLEVLLEVHKEEELVKLCDDIDIVGVNNRDLHDFSVDINRSMFMAPKIPSKFVKISESGISDPETIKKLHSIGYKGFLIGEYFMKQADPALACKNLIEKL